MKALLAEQAFSRQLQKGLVQSGTSEIESYSEEEFSNIPDRPDRDRLLKMVSQDSLNHSKPSTEDEDVQNAADKVARIHINDEKATRKQQEEQQRALLEQQQAQRNKEEERRIENERVNMVTPRNIRFIQLFSANLMKKGEKWSKRSAN